MRLIEFADANNLFLSIARHPTDMGWTARIYVGSGEGHYASLVWIREKNVAPFFIGDTPMSALEGLLNLVRATTLVIGNLHHRDVWVPAELTL